MRALLRKLGNPHLAIPSIIVAGTNGKGSTSATLASILEAAGYRTGIYTSPHLVDIRERWGIGGEPITPALLDESIRDLQSAAERSGISPTYFEALTLIAFIAFEKAACEVSVLEVGMGGRLDATNVVRPVAALITPIGFDHTEYLGNTLRKIAAEKAGVIHRGAIVLTTNRDEPVLGVLRKRAAKFGNPFHVVPRETKIPPSPLPGEFQRDNVALAVRAAEELAPRLDRITPEAIVRGVAATHWRGRLERYDIGGKDVRIDGCHNAHAAAAIAPFVSAQMPEPRTLVFGIMTDKNVRDVAAILFPLFGRVITTNPYPPRAESAEVLAELARGFGAEAVVEPDPDAAIRKALASDARSVLVAGSLYLAGSAIALLDSIRSERGGKGR